MMILCKMKIDKVTQALGFFDIRGHRSDRPDPQGGVRRQVAPRRPMSGLPAT